MDYDQFLSTVAQRAHIDRDAAGRAANATLENLAARLSTGEARQVADELPPEMFAWLVATRGPETFDVDEFLDRIAQGEGVDRETARRHARAVFIAVEQAISAGEFGDLIAELPQDFEPLLTGRAIASVDEIVGRIAAETGLGHDAARHSLDAVLETLAERIPAGEVDDLISGLPPALHEPLKRGKANSDATARRMPVEEFVIRVGTREGTTIAQAAIHARVVLAALRKALPEEYFDATVELPPEYSPLLPGS